MRVLAGLARLYVVYPCGAAKASQKPHRATLPYADDADHLRTKPSSGIWRANPGERAVEPCARPLLGSNRAVAPWPAP